MTCATLLCQQGTAALGVMLTVQSCSGGFDDGYHSFLTIGLGAMAGGGVSWTNGPMYTNATKSEDLGGPFGGAGASLSGVLLTGGFDGAIGLNATNQNIWTVSGQGGLGAKSLLGPEIHAEGTNTWVFGPSISGGSGAGF